MCSAVAKRCGLLFSNVRACGAQGVLFLREPFTYAHELTPTEERHFRTMPPIGRREMYAIRSALNAVEDDITHLWQ